MSNDQKEVEMSSKFRVCFKWINGQMVPVEVVGPEGTRCLYEGEVVKAVFVGSELVYRAKGFCLCDAV